MVLETHSSPEQSLLTVFLAFLFRSNLRDSGASSSAFFFQLSPPKLAKYLVLSFMTQFWGCNSFLFSFSFFAPHPPPLLLLFKRHNRLYIKKIEIVWIFAIICDKYGIPWPWSIELTDTSIRPFITARLPSQGNRPTLVPRPSFHASSSHTHACPGYQVKVSKLPNIHSEFVFA